MRKRSSWKKTCRRSRPAGELCHPATTLTWACCMGSRANWTSLPNKCRPKRNSILNLKHSWTSCCAISRNKRRPYELEKIFQSTGCNRQLPRDDGVRNQSTTFRLHRVQGEPSTLHFDLAAGEQHT